MAKTECSFSFARIIEAINVITHFMPIIGGSTMFDNIPLSL